MSNRIFVAGLLGAIAMFVWSSIAHLVTPLGEIGVSQIPNEAPVLSAMQASMGDHPGLYIFPWVDMKAPDAMAKSLAAIAAHPAGIMVYHPPGTMSANPMPLMIGEFAKQLVMTLMAAWLLSMAAITGFLNRVVFVTAIGVIATLSTNVSYLVWYGFPLDYTLSYMFIEVVEMLCAGLAIAWWFGRGEPSRA